MFVHFLPWSNEVKDYIILFLTPQFVLVSVVVFLSISFDIYFSGAYFEILAFISWDCFEINFLKKWSLKNFIVLG